MLLFSLSVAIATAIVSTHLNQKYIIKEFDYISFDTKYVLFDHFSQK